MRKEILALTVLTGCALGLGQPPDAISQETVPFYLKDRGPGIPTSMFGTYVQKGEWIVYPFFEFYLDNNKEYDPSEFGFTLEQDFRGKYRENEILMFLAYGLTDRLAIEVEAARAYASLEKAPEDLSGMPDKIAESGLGDVQAEIRWMWSKETERRPGFFGYGEVVFPHHKTKYLIGTPELETKAGIGLIRGFRWGTITLRAAVEQAGGVVDLGEYAVEYYKRLSKSLCVYAGIEGTQDEVEFISEFQVWLSDTVRIKINNAFGLTTKATGWAPEVGIMFSFPRR